ncbi:hepatoma-derived growth factor-related protein 2 [Chelmon rostratus]|uniref:hepatoma-derived growth factor-related protein 2 n=1 Tax=Chelmon rostratus TaxID=109905 RepID=UPI001BE8835D|nr:hepatoma-derived growth factor-related protein 2 [Chelmon rostratus]XP_041796520.1 hepatoma-derived growth factor-related protein 2 [Chelmon rostratus]XP_041796528.1 hepatoma-derived growth factor-related protein 2 [Chelmon rostratus]
MAAVGAEVAWLWFLSPGVSFFIFLLLLSVFLTALCSDCRRRSFELRESEVDKNPSTLISVVKLEEAMGPRENPTISEIQTDEDENMVTFTPWRSHLVAPQHHQDVKTNGSAPVMRSSESDTAEEENSVPFTPWRSHLRAPQSQDLNSFALPDSDHIYHIIGGGRSSSGGDADVSSAPTNQEPAEERGPRSAAAADLSDDDFNLLYAQISKKERLTTPPPPPPPPVQEEEEEEEEEEPSPPLPDRRTQLEG